MRAFAAPPGLRTLRAASLIALGSFLLHDLRYALDPAASGAIWAGEHGYLEAALPLAAATALALIAASLFRRLLPGAPRARARPLDRTGLYAAALLGVHLGQEAIEAMIAGGLEPKLIIDLLAVAAFSIPLALALGGIAALVASWLDQIEHRIGFALAGLRAAGPPTALLAPVVFTPGNAGISSLRQARGPPRSSARA